MEPNEQTPETNHQQIEQPRASHIAPQWAALLAALAFGILYAALPEHVTPGPSWLPLVIEVAFFLPIVLAALLRRPLPYVTKRIFVFVVLQRFAKRLTGSY